MKTRRQTVEQIKRNLQEAAGAKGLISKREAITIYMGCNEHSRKPREMLNSLRQVKGTGGKYLIDDVAEMIYDSLE